MCGLFGWYFPKENEIKESLRKTIFKGLGYKSQFRGTESFGVYFINKEGKNERIRFVGKYTEWAEENEEKINEIIKSRVVLAHTRLANRGEVNVRNCHPFNIGHHICAHNGTISNSSELGKTLKYNIPVGETDSEAAFCWLIENGFTKEKYKQLKGNFNFTIFNQKKNVFRLVTDNTIYYCSVGDGIIYQSESSPVQVVATMLGLKQFWSLTKKELIIDKNGSKINSEIESATYWSSQAKSSNFDDSRFGAYFNQSAP